MLELDVDFHNADLDEVGARLDLELDFIVENRAQTELGRGNSF